MPNSKHRGTEEKIIKFSIHHLLKNYFYRIITIKNYNIFTL